MTIPAKDLYRHVAGPDDTRAAVSIDLDHRAAQPINPFLYAKFCEHLGANIYNGMDAQILRNPTFGVWKFGGGSLPDGGSGTQSDPEKVQTAIENGARRMGLPDGSKLREAYESGGAFPWERLNKMTRLSPDVGQAGGRAQRVEFLLGRGGIGQWIFLPCHRTRKYQFRVFGRASAPASLRLAVAALGPEGTAGDELAGQDFKLNTDWSVVTGTLDIGAATPAEALYFLSLSGPEGTNVVLSRVLLWPADHLNGADPDVVARLRQSKLPLLRWPGGNFASGYHWRDGVGPADLRPTGPNPAWDGLEYHLFGTDEFMAFCRAVGCEPMICVNAGNGTAEEAAQWVEYCNGPADSPMGRLRAANGHPEPYGVRFWEVGNELYGRWQVSWTTPDGYVDRYKRFAAAMRKVDPSIELIACGQDFRTSWNKKLFTEATDQMSCVTIHVLRGGQIEAGTDAGEIYEAFMGLPSTEAENWRVMEQQMKDANIAKPHLAVTELQLFARPKGPIEHLPNPATIAEPLYDTLLIHECIRLGGFVNMITHSATVNHGGGLRKSREVVWVNPAHWGHVMGTELAGLWPVPVQVQCGTYSTPKKVGDLPAVKDLPLVDAMAAVSGNGKTLRVMLVNRSARVEEIAVTLQVAPEWVDGKAEVVTLVGGSTDDQNTQADPDRIRPRTSEVPVKTGQVVVKLPRFSMVRVTLNR